MQNNNFAFINNAPSVSPAYALPLLSQKVPWDLSLFLQEALVHSQCVPSGCMGK